MDLFLVETAEFASVLWTLSIKSFSFPEQYLVLYIWSSAQVRAEILPGPLQLLLSGWRDQESKGPARARREERKELVALAGTVEMIVCQI